MTDPAGYNDCTRCGVRTPSKIICDGCWQDWKLYGVGGDPPTCKHPDCDIHTAWDDGLCDRHGPAEPS